MGSQIYLLDEEPINVDEFLRDNADFTPEQSAEVRALKPGQQIVYGGGAIATSILRCEDDARVLFLARLEAFSRAATELYLSWEGTNLGGDEGADDYPFSDSFDETVLKIGQWFQTQKRQLGAKS